jgi:hypothetical protein
MTVETEEFNGESIQFTWAIDFARCMAYVQGFILKVMDITESKTQSLNVKKDCFNISSDTVTFDTSHSCSNVTIDPCTDYFIEITPRLFDRNYSLAGNNASTTTSPGKNSFL